MTEGKIKGVVRKRCVVHVGMYERDAAAAGIEIDTFKVPLSDVNRAVTDGEEHGFVKMHVRKGTGNVRRR